MADVFRKTELGYQEIATRQNGLPLMLRRILIMIDGRRDMTELMDSLQINNLHLLVQALEVEGYVELIGFSAA